MTIIGKKDGKLKSYDIDSLCAFVDLKKYFDEIFEIDSRMATIIILLNEKGYLTEMSCEEHYNNSIESDFFSEDEIPADTIVENKTEDGNECYYIIQNSIQRSFVRFKDAYNFAQLPQGWKMEGKVYLYHEYDFDLSEYDFYIEQSKALKMLYDWAVVLPENLK